MFNWTHRSTASFIMSLLLSGTLLHAQKPSAGGDGSAGSAGSTAGTASTGTRGNPTNSPTLNPTNPNNNGLNNDPFAERPIFLSGKVIFDDGSPMNPNVQVQKVCGTSIQIEAHPDSKGRFSFQVGGPEEAALSVSDASIQNSGLGGQRRGQNSPFGDSGGGSGSSRFGSSSGLWGCDLQAYYPGYRSDTVTLAGRRSLDDPNVGTIILHRLTAVQGTTISLTTAEAPKGAMKNYEKGMEATRKGKFEEAEQRMLEATNVYPKFAVAWFALGQLQQRSNQNEQARKSYSAAIEADKKYVSPYDQLALLAARDGKWEEAANYSKQAIDLNPVEFPSSFWYNAIANYNLKKDADAAKSAQALIKLDVRHRYPEVNRIMADISVSRKDYTGAAGYLRSYLEQAPTAKDADSLKQLLLRFEEASAQK